MGSKAEDKRLGRAGVNKQVLELSQPPTLVEITQLAVVMKPSRDSRGGGNQLEGLREIEIEIGKKGKRENECIRGLEE